MRTKNSTVTSHRTQIYLRWLSAALLHDHMQCCEQSRSSALTDKRRDAIPVRPGTLVFLVKTSLSAASRGLMMMST